MSAFHPLVIVVATSLACVAMVGCGSPGSVEHAADQQRVDDGHDHSEHEHPHAGPHGGQLVELGANEEYHAELVHDEDIHHITIYILDGSAKNLVPIAEGELTLNMVSGEAPKQYKLQAAPQPTDPAEMASCFELTSEELGNDLHNDASQGRITVMIGGKQFVGQIEHHDHDH